LDWTLDLFFPKNFVQILTLQGIDRTARRLAYIRRHPTISLLDKPEVTGLSSIHQPSETQKG
jgi:hypothetical protein